MTASTGARICLVTSGHLASNPRLVKEADALDAAGYDVTVVAVHHLPQVGALDETVLAARRWRCLRIATRIGVAARIRRLLARWTRRLGSRRLKVAIAAHSPFTARLQTALEQVPAQLYIAHNLAALPAAWRAARRHGACLGFDAEDYHPGELATEPEHRLEIENRVIMLAALLPDCGHLTAASPLIAAEYQQRFGVHMMPLLNVFPRRAATAGADTPVTDEDGLRFYWFSQTVSRDRGIEEFLAVMAHMRHDASLVLQGHASAAVTAALDRAAKELGVNRAIRYLPMIPPDEIIDSARRFDVGLSLEQTEPRNRALCLTNKIFSYLQAGLPQVLSDTPAQRDIAGQLGEAAVLVDLNDPVAAARRIDESLADRGHRRRAARAARALAEEPFCWETEQHKFLGSVRRCLAAARAPSGTGQASAEALAE